MREKCGATINTYGRQTTQVAADNSFVRENRTCQDRSIDNLVRADVLEISHAIF